MRPYLLLFNLTISLAVAFSADSTVFAAQEWYVATSGSDGISCTSAENPCATINYAITLASAGDVIFVASGTYTGTGEEVVRISKDVTLSGGWDAAFAVQKSRSIIDGEEERRGILVDAVQAVVDNFTIENGRPTGNYQPFGSSISGGGIFNFGALTLNNCTVTRNSAGHETWSGGSGGGGITN